MKCPKCGNEYSLKVYRIHNTRCPGIAVEGKSEKEELIEQAEELGVVIDKRWGKERIAEAINGG